MTIEQLKEMVKEVVQEQIAPLQEVQRRYAGELENNSQLQNSGEAEHKGKGPELEPGIRLARLAKLMVLGKNDPERALHFAKKMYPDDEEIKASLKALSASTPSDGGFLIQEQYAQEIIPLLRAKAVVRRLGARPLPMPSGNLNLPKITGGATSYYIGENMDAKKSQPKFGNLKLSGKKLVTLVPISNDLIRSASPEADRMVRDDMVQSMALKEDWAALYGSGTEYVPAGVINTKGIAKGSLNAVPTSDDMANMIGLLLTKNLPWMSPGWVFNGALWSVLYNLKDGTGNYIHREEMNQNKFLGLPFAISNQVTYNTDTHKTTDIFLGDWSEFIIGEQMGLEVMASQEASYMDDNGKLVSAFSLDQTVIKVTSIHDFGVRHAEAFNVKTGVYTVA